MGLDKMIENKKEDLYHFIESKGILHQDTINLSQELDKLIVKKMGSGHIEA